MTGPLAYIGGKRRLAPTLVDLLPPHTTYVEPFAGGAQVLFHKSPSKVEVLNDLNGEVVNFFRVCQFHHEELIRYLTHIVVSRRLYELFQRQDPTTLTDVQRAARFLYLQKASFGGKVRQQNYGYRVSDMTFDPTQLPDRLRAVSARLARVQLECWPYERVLERFDRPTTVFYCDPPYVGFRLYPQNFADQDFHVLAERLKKLRGKFLLSINEHPVARDAFAPFTIRPVAVSYSASGHPTRDHELIVANFALPASPFISSSCGSNT
jgi:DNA adenine methylase